MLLQCNDAILSRDPLIKVLEGLCQREKNMTFKIVSACLLVHTQPSKGFSGPSKKIKKIKDCEKERKGKERKENYS